MIDTHNHILPYCDDGAANWIQAESMAKQAAEQGIATIVATPHHRKGVFLNRPAHIQDLVERLNVRLQTAGIPVRVLTGQEYHMNAMVTTDLEAGDLQCVARSRYVLVELSSRFPPKLVPSYLRLLRQRHMEPVIVHPERYRMVIENPSLLSLWLKEGAYFQLTAGSLLGQFGPDIQRTAYTIAEYDHVHLLASDAHDVNMRSNRLRSAYQLLTQEFGRTLADRLIANAGRMLEGEPLLIGAPRRYQRAKWYAISFMNR